MSLAPLSESTVVSTATTGTATPYLVPMRSASPCAEPGSPPQRSGEAADERAARALAITESLRKRRRDPAATPGPELAEAQASLERRIRAHLARDRRVLWFRDAPLGAGSWGATVLEIDPEREP